MKTWLSGEVDSIIGEKFRITINRIEEEMNKMLLTNFYGDGLESLDIIFIISKTPGKEKIKFNKKSKETDIRVSVDFDSFYNADQNMAREILYHYIVKCVYNLSEVYETLDFNATLLIKDLNSILLNGK